ncbi:MAG: ABC transporter substrate-binding protein [Solirubrobacteraceae bacterium]
MTVAGTLLAAALAATGCGSDDGGGPTGGDADEIVVGTIMPLSGPQEALSNSYDGMRAAFAKVNADGGIGGRKIKVVVRDDQFNPAQTPKAARELVESEGVVMLCSNQGSGTLKAISPYLEAHGVGSVAQSGETDLFPADSTAFQMLTPYDETAAMLAEHFVKAKNRKKIAIAYTNDGIGEPFRKGAEAHLKSLGITPVAAVSFNAAAADQSAVAAKLRASGAEVVLVNHVAPVIAQLARATARVGFRPEWGTTYAAQNKQLVKLGGASLRGRVVFATPFPLEQAPVLAEYRTSMAERYPKTDASDFLTIEGYAAGKVCAGVLRHAAEAAGDDAPSREQVLDALKGYSLDAEGVRGLRWSAEDHTGPRGLQLVELRGSRFEQIADFELAPEVAP